MHHQCKSNRSAGKTLTLGNFDPKQQYNASHVCIEVVVEERKIGQPRRKRSSSGTEQQKGTQQSTHTQHTQLDYWPY